MDPVISWKIKGENIVNAFFKSRKNSNCLLELEELLLSTNEECVQSMFQIVLDFFSKAFSMDLLNTSNDDKYSSYKLWLLERYESFISHLLSYLSHKNDEIKVSSLHTLLSFVNLESKYPRKNEKENLNFPFSLFKRIVSCLASNILNQWNLIKEFLEYTRYPDVKLYLLKAVNSLLSSSEEITECFLQNCFYLLCIVKYPKKFADSVETETFAYRADSPQTFQLREKHFQKLFSSVWNSLLNYELSPELLRKVLSALNENVLPHLQNPCLMTDFLTNSYNKGSVLSLLALKGLYLLMDKYNLEYPDFFVKLYALLDEKIINGKFSARFFDLADLFLSSTHLPSHIVAAFIKKLSRISLISHTDNILKILRLISNLLVQHPSLGVLIHRNTQQEFRHDPFLKSSTDPAKNNAMESSLWEIQMLQFHVNPDVSCKAKDLTANYPKLYSEIPATSFQDLYKKSRKRKLEDAPLALSKPPVKLKRDGHS